MTGDGSSGRAVVLADEAALGSQSEVDETRIADEETLQAQDRPPQTVASHAHVPVAVAPWLQFPRPCDV